MFATALNLLPGGQLDGGHILYSFFPKRHRMVSRILCLAMLPGWWFWQGWTFWGLILLWLGRRHPLIEDPAPLDDDRRRLGWVALAIFALCLSFAPFSNGGL